MKRLVIALVVALLAAPAAFAWERTLYKAPDQPKGKHWEERAKSFELYAWQAKLFGHATVKGMNVDFESDSSFGTKTRIGGNVFLPLSKRWNLGFTYNSFDHTGTINKTVTFDNQNYALGAQLRLQNSWFDITNAYLLSDSDQGYIDALLGAKVAKASIDVTGVDNANAALARTGSWSENYPIPYIGVGGGYKASDRVWLNGHVKWFSANGGGANARTIDFDANVAYQLNKPSKKLESEWSVFLGYRQFSLQGDFDNDSAKIGYSGPVFGLMGRFF